MKTLDLLLSVQLMIKRVQFLLLLHLRKTIQDHTVYKEIMWPITQFKTYSRLKAFISSTQLVNLRYSRVVAPAIHMLWRCVDASGTERDLTEFLAPLSWKLFPKRQRLQNPVQKEKQIRLLLPISQAR